MANYNIDAIYNGSTSLPGTERIRIDSSGNIGIGTTNPVTLLQIGTGTPTSVTGGIQFGSDVSARLYRTAPGVITCPGTIAATFSGSLTGNVTGTATTANSLNTANNYQVKNLTVSEKISFANRNAIYSLWHGGAQDLAWKKIADVTLGTNLYAAASFKIEVLDAEGNFGWSVNCRPMVYFAACRRSGGVLNDYDDAVVSGPINDYVRVVKTATGVYELQIRQIQDWQILIFTCELITSSGTITYATGTPANGSTTGTIYTVTTNGYTQYFPKVSASLFSGPGTGLTGTAAGLSIGGNAANVTGVVLVPNGGTGVSTANANTFFAGPSSGSTAAAPSFRTITTADIPSNIGLTNPTINNIRMGYTSTATAGGTTTLTVNSNIYQRFTGATTQTITLPVTSTLVAGMSYTIENISTGNLTVNSSGGNLVITVIPGVTVTCLCVGTALTTAADWDAEYDEFASITGTGSVVLSTSPTLVTPALGTPASGNLTNCTFPILNQNTTGTALNVTGTVAIANGGTGATTAAQARTNLGIATSSGTVTSITAGDGLSGGTINSTGTIAVDATVVRTSNNQTIGGTKTFSSTINGSINGNAGSVSDGVYLSTNQTITGTKTFSNAIVAPNAAKAWVHFNGTGVVAKNADYNVSSIGDNGVGDYTVNFTNALADANYVVAGTATYLYTDNILLNQLVVAVPRYTNAQLAGSCRIVCEYIHGAQLFDAVAVRVVFYR